MNTDRHSTGPRRGNTMVLVVGILVLLTIIATSYLTRTHAGRVTAISQQRASLRDDNARAIAAFLAGEVSGALFARPVDPTAAAPFNSNTPRLSPRQNPVRYGVDRDANGDGRADYPFNFAPYWVVPFTNWPDALQPTDRWPKSHPSAPFGQDLLLLYGVGEGNPLGNPGFGDARWLADLEPLRWDTNNDGVADAFSHWRHLTNVARPDNGWRIAPDIANIYRDDDGDGYYETLNVMLDLGVPVEQWLPILPISLDPVTGDSAYDPANFWPQWINWFSEVGYAVAYTNSAAVPFGIPANFYNLSNLDGGLDDDGDGDRMDWYERPEAEFIRGTARWNVSRILADADGDGFTDSFWFLAPTPVERGIRQVVAVRVVDNSGLVNARTATGFVRTDPGDPGLPRTRTKGLTPADVALTGQLLPYDLWLALPDREKQWNVGFYDNPLNWYDLLDDSTRFDEVRYDDDVAAGNPAGIDPVDLWVRHLDETGLLPYVESADQFAPDYLRPNQALRLDYWRLAGLPGLDADPAAPFAPFGLPEEIELRMFYGNNEPWIYSRLEHSTQARSGSAYGFLRGSPARAESSEYRLQLGNRDLVGDPRHRLTVYSGARNDIMPPWLWSSLYLPPVDIDGDGVVGDTDDERQFTGRHLKCDLRRPTYDLDVDGDGIANEFVTTLPPSPYDDDVNDDMFGAGGGIDERDHYALIRRRLEAALIDADSGVSYFGSAAADRERTERMAASMTANVVAYRDADTEPLTLDRAIAWEDPGTGTYLRYPGLERQPFLVEAFIAHVYEYGAVATVDHPLDGISVDDHVLCAESPESTMVIVQIANPFDRPVDLGDFVLEVFDQPLDFAAAGLAQPLGPGEARTFYSMESGAAGPVDAAMWKGLLGVVNGPDAVNVTALNVWSNHRSPDYDTNADHAVELLRRIDNGQGVPVPVLVDRIDIKPGSGAFTGEPFGQTIVDLPSYGGTCEEPDPAVAWTGVRNLGSDEHYAQMVRASRAWEMDVNGTPGIQADERNPRYVFANMEVESSERTFTNGQPFLGGAALARFDDRNKGNLGTIDDRLDFAMQMLQKDADFEQVGELLNVWAFGPELRFDGSGPLALYTGTTSTFSEFLWDEIENQGLPADARRGVNRLRVTPTDTGSATISPVIGGPTTPAVANPFDPMHRIPGLPAGARVLDAFVCDRGGLNPGDADGDGVPDTLNDEYVSRLGLAHGFTGLPTPGLININTAPVEVLRALPHWTRLVHETGLDATGLAALTAPTPQVRLAEAAVRYRERFAATAGAQPEPGYGDRDGLLADGLRADRGFAAAAELMLLDRQPFAPDAAYRKSWQIDLARQDPFEFAGGPLPIESTRVSTDVVDGYDADTLAYGPDAVAGDVEEEHLLYSGLSNLVTTRSDTFTVYFKVRSFRQNPTTGAWDATDPAAIVDESRYVMLVDRSAVNHPDQKPRILYMEKLPR